LFFHFSFCHVVRLIGLFLGSMTPSDYARLGYRVRGW
jgi:hypothetical protein